MGRKERKRWGELKNMYLPRMWLHWEKPDGVRQRGKLDDYAGKGGKRKSGLPSTARGGKGVWGVLFVFSLGKGRKKKKGCTVIPKSPRCKPYFQDK